MGWLQRFFGTGSLRTTGEPRSSNGASSFHLWWVVPSSKPLVAVSAILEVIEPPAVDRLYFWALQASFVDEFTGRLGGGAHLGLQHNPRHPGSGAVNWGGYASQADGGDVLDGSDSALPGIPGDRNTRNFRWRTGRGYRLRIARSPDPGSEDAREAWRGSVTDLVTGEVTVVRDLYARGGQLMTPLVWTESFARCDHPGVAVRWSDLSVEAVDGSIVRPEAVRVSYQARAAGGCDNTTVEIAGTGIVQRTTAPRTVRDRAVLPWSSG